MNGSPFHADELAAQSRAGVKAGGVGIRPTMPDQHRAFFEMLPYVFVATLDTQTWPLATFLTGQPGFVRSPDPVTLRIEAKPSADDPAAGALRSGDDVGVLGIDFSNRRRNRANGRVAAVDASGFTVAVRQSFGNCPQYIQRRELHVDVASEPSATTAEVDSERGQASGTPRAAAAVMRDHGVRSVRRLPPGRAPPPVEFLTSLDAEATALIQAADTFFVASRSRPDVGEAGGADISHRGGRPGFVRVDGNTLTIPDFRGNRYFNTLGNLSGEPRGALLFVDFERGDVLQLQGTARIDWSAEAAQRLEAAERLWYFEVVRAWRRRMASPIRGTFIDYSPVTLRTGVWS